MSSVELTRTVRFSPGRDPNAPAVNSYAGHPAIEGLGRHYELDVRCRGEADPTTGYFVDIREIDQAVRERVIPVIAACVSGSSGREPSGLIGELLDALLGSDLGGRVAGLRWWLTPYHCVEMTTDRRDIAVLRQRFDFAAAHRLHVPSLSDERNRELFGKCNNPNGHGHNYGLEPAVEVATGSGAPAFTLADLERITREVVLARFDHKHLNLDTAEFGPDSGLNPSVENIARVAFELLEPAIGAAGGVLRGVTIWETEKTSCTYPAIG